jgi:predicted HTH domain antitoxin
LRALSLGLRELGLGPDDKLIILSENRPEWVMTSGGIDRSNYSYYHIHILLHIYGGAMKRTNIMLTENQHKTIKAYARKEGKTLGYMVRDALDVVYKKKDILERRKQTALNAYGEGLISLGKLAEILGLDPVSARLYLKDLGISLQVQDRSGAAGDAALA